MDFTSLYILLAIFAALLGLTLLPIEIVVEDCPDEEEVIQDMSQEVHFLANKKESKANKGAATTSVM